MPFVTFPIRWGFPVQVRLFVLAHMLPTPPSPRLFAASPKRVIPHGKMGTRHTITVRRSAGCVCPGLVSDICHGVMPAQIHHRLVPDCQAALIGHLHSPFTDGHPTWRVRISHHPPTPNTPASAALPASTGWRQPESKDRPDVTRRLALLVISFSNLRSSVVLEENESWPF